MMGLRGRLHVLAVLAAFGLGGCGEPAQERSQGLEPNWESIRTHTAPDWYQDAKFGIFIHWGVYSVPGWAMPSGELGQVDWELWFRNNAYAEWYLNTLRIEESPTQQYHFETYGEDFDYLDFVPQFNQELKKWDPGAMAQLFREVGARYVVLTSKHHDGFTLWPSQVPNPNRPPELWHASRDVVGELTQAVRQRGMRMGLYYSGGLDWSFTSEPIVNVKQVTSTVLHTDEYAAYADSHWRELIKRYQPDILWNDIAYPKQGDLEHILADYYNRFPDGVINDRWPTFLPDGPQRHHDFATAEYQSREQITEEKWEACRGLGYSFGFNRQEGPEQTISEKDLVHLLIDIVSKNGNLLLNVGPHADGSIPEIQVERLRALGRWLEVNGEGIYGTRPWVRAEGQTGEGGEVRFTRKGESVYAFLLERPAGREVVLESVSAPEGADVSLLGQEGVLAYRAEEGNLVISLPDDLPQSHAYTLKIR